MRLASRAASHRVFLPRPQLCGSASLPMFRLVSIWIGLTALVPETDSQKKQASDLLGANVICVKESLFAVYKLNPTIFLDDPRPVTSQLRLEIG